MKFALLGIPPICKILLKYAAYLGPGYLSTTFKNFHSPYFLIQLTCDKTKFSSNLRGYKPMLTLHLSWSKKSQISFLFSTAAITLSGRQFLKGSLTWQNILLVTCKIERICYTTSNQMQTDDKRVTSTFSYCARAVWKFLLICLCKYYLDMQEMNDAYSGDTWRVGKKSS